MSGLTPPVSEQDHRIGPDDAPVTLVEYGDYECPHCGAAHPILQQLKRRLGDTLRFVYRHFPLSEMHPHAQHAAETAEAAAEQGEFWEMHDILFDNQDALDDRDLLRYAGALGLDAQRVATELTEGTHEERVRRDFLSGVRSGVNGTPTLFLNGQRHEGPWDLDTLIAAVERAAGG
jgi:protein-disulfide isomerase